MTMDSLTAATQAEALATLLPILDEGRHEEALPLLEEHLQTSPEDPLWHYLMGLTMACLAQGAEGLEHLEAAAQSHSFSSDFGLPPKTVAAIKSAALNHLQFETSLEEAAEEPWKIFGRFAELLEKPDFFEKSIVGRFQASPQSRDAMLAFQDHFEGATPDSVIPILDEIVAKGGERNQARALLGAFLQQKGKTALAIRHLKTALDADPQAMEPHLYLGKIYVAQARFDDAEKELALAMEKGTGPSVPLLVELANCQKATYRYDEALKTLIEAFELQPSSFKHWDQLVELAQSTGQASQLFESLRSAVDKNPQDRRLRQRFAMFAHRHGDPLAAQEQLRATGIYENPSKDQALARLASEVAQVLGDGATAFELTQALWSQSPTNPETSRLYGEALINGGKPRDAESVLRETARNHPNDRGLQVAWGRALMAMGDAERAHRAFGLASRLDPDDPESMAEQGRAMISLGMADEAQNILKESAKKADPPLAVTLVGLGACYEQKRLHDISRDFFRQALLRDDGRVDAARGLIRTSPVGPSSQFAEDILDLAAQLPHGFAKLRLFLTLLRAAFIENRPAESRILKEHLYPVVVKNLPSEAYLSYLQQAETKMLSELARDLESHGEPEKAREIWRYAVTSSIPELSQKASAELIRLDTYEASLPESPQSAETSAVTEGDAAPAPELISPTDEDPLLSLLSTTLPAGTGEEADLFLTDSESPNQQSQEEAPLFADPVEETERLVDDLFASDPLFEEPDAPPVSFQASEPVAEDAPLAMGSPSSESDLFAPSGETMAVMIPEETSEAAAPPSTPSAAPIVDEVIATPAPLVEEPVATPAEPPVAQEPVGTVATSSPSAVEHEDPPASFEIPLPTPLKPTDPPSPPPERETPVETSLGEPAPPEEPFVQEEATADFSAHGGALAQPSATSGPAVPETIAPPTDTREELLPIPMAADFQPLTRRQLHYHEALTASGAGVINPESLAHLLLQSAVGHEPPDPGSQSGQSSMACLQKALLESAKELEQSQQFRGAVRVLRTGLLYDPRAEEVLEALARVQQLWATWLGNHHEYAHAVGLLRDCLQRQPNHEAAGAQLETVYRQWMAWSDENGDSGGARPPRGLPRTRDYLIGGLAQGMGAVPKSRSRSAGPSSSSAGGGGTDHAVGSRCRALRTTGCASRPTGAGSRGATSPAGNCSCPASDHSRGRGSKRPSRRRCSRRLDSANADPVGRRCGPRFGNSGSPYGQCGFRSGLVASCNPAPPTSLCAGYADATRGRGPGVS